MLLLCILLYNTVFLLLFVVYCIYYCFELGLHLVTHFVVGSISFDFAQDDNRVFQLYRKLQFYFLARELLPSVDGQVLCQWTDKVVVPLRND